jgi:hypothetical protein
MAQTKLIYPPFSTGILIEQYMNEYFKINGKVGNRKFINVNWTNIFVNKTFTQDYTFDENYLTQCLDKLNKNDQYFTVVQLDDGILYKLPPNCMVFGCCSNIPIPLVYDTNLFHNLPKKTFIDKKIFCSFIGSLTHDVRQQMIQQLNPHKFTLLLKQWNPNIESNQQNLFINVTLDSKFVLAPRGYGRNSFRFWEALEMHSIPIYIWDDIDFLPFKDKIDYTQLCVNINVSQLNNLENILLNIDEQKYNTMLQYYQQIKHLYTYEGICDYILEKTLL